MIYFDHNATTPILPEVMDVMKQAMEEYWGNPSSTHSMGRQAYARLEKARERLAGLLGASPKEIFFTSGGTEADNLAILGIMEQHPGAEILVSSIEHPAVYDSAHECAKANFIAKDIPVNSDGIIISKELENLINDKTRLISVMYANNETGTIQPVSEIGELAEKKSIVFHSDAVQAFGKVPVNVSALHVSLLSVSSHKIYGPKGCGALYIKQGTKIIPHSFGGSQERGVRTGTENLPAILGFVRAAEIACDKLNEESKRLSILTRQLFTQITAKIENVIRNGHADLKIPGTLNLCIPGAETESVLASLDQEGICASGGAACSSGSISASRTLLALGRRKADAVCAIRFSLGRGNTAEQVTNVAEVLEKVIERIRNVNK
jgi:cysteine desulfurase